MRIVRRAKTEDAQGIHEAHMRSIQEVCSKDHTQQEISGWGHRPFNEAHRTNSINKHLVWVVENEGKIEGYGQLGLFSEEGKILGSLMGLYLAPEALGFGLGAEIVRAMIAEAKSRGAFAVGLESTLTAHGFYQKMGFVDAGPQATAEIGGSMVRYIPMKLTLENSRE